MQEPPRNVYALGAGDNRNVMGITNHLDSTRSTMYTYDAENRLTQKSYTDGTTPTLGYGFDGAAPGGCATTPPSVADSNPIHSRSAMCDRSGATCGSPK